MTCHDAREQFSALVDDALSVDARDAVIGGFHLAPYTEDYVRQTIAALKEMDVDYVIPLHCSGEVFYELAKAEMPVQLLRSYTGTRFVFEGGSA